MKWAFVPFFGGTDMPNTWRYIWGALGALCFVFYLWITVGDLSLLYVPIDQDNIPQKLESLVLFIGIIFFGLCYGIYGAFLWLRWELRALLAYPIGFIGAWILFLLSGTNMDHLSGLKLGLLALPLSAGAFSILYALWPNYFERRHPD